jgi:hypothetical protein
MNWRRGLLFASIHLAVAGTLIAWLDVQDAQYRTSIEENTAEAKREAVAKPVAPTNPETVPATSGQDEEMVSFDPCALWREIPPQETIVDIGELPAATLTGWGQECPASWTLYGMLHQKPARSTFREIVTAEAEFGVLIILQWMVIGGFPLIQQRRWWEPGAFITICVLLAFVLVLIPKIGTVSKLPILFAVLAWLWWFGLLVWKCSNRLAGGYTKYGKENKIRR